MLKCPRCGRKGRKEFKGFCSKVHYELSKPQKKLRLSCAVCGTAVIRSPSQVSRGGRVYCPRCSKNTGETHPRWKEGQYINDAGYRLVLYKDSYVLQHRLTWEQENRACILREAPAIIHHINFDKADNRPQNLALLSSKLHGQIHRLIDAGEEEVANQLLVQELEDQAYFILHPEYLNL